MNAHTHAEVRAQQRGVPPLVEQWLDIYGEETYDGHGGCVRYFSRSSRRAMERALGRAPVRKLEQYLDVYKVVSNDDGSTITVGHRYKRIRRR